MALKLSATTVSQIPVKDLLPDPEQPREAFDKDALQALADNIKARGVQVPLLVRMGAGKGQIVIKDGERRWRAAKQLKLKSVPCLLASSDNAAQIRLDQVTVNNLRERLKPMELAKTLARMRDLDKLSVNEIAAKLTKQGMKVSRAEIENLLKLVALPDWAQAMVNEEQIEVASAREIAGIKDKPVLVALQKHLKDSASWRGRVTPREATSDIRTAYRDAAAADLRKTESYYSDPVLFDYKKVCKGCPHLRETHGEALCMDEAGFKKHQAEAKEAGLGPGGSRAKKSATESTDKDRPLTDGQQKKLDAQKAEQRQVSLEGKSRYYLHGWARRRIVDHLSQDIATSSVSRIVLFATACHPGIPGYERGNASTQNQAERNLRTVATDHGMPTLGHFLKALDIPESLMTELARQVVLELPLIETLQLHHHLFGSDLSALWKVDAAYLDLLQKAELVEVAEKHAQLPEGRKAWGALKTAELVAAILAVSDKVGVPPALSRIYADIERASVHVDDDVGDSEDDDFGDDE
jgi:ParB/RepB/Spo0J family partition protein